jgi:hypothetical protein
MDITWDWWLDCSPGIGGAKMSEVKIDFKQNFKDWYAKLKTPVPKGRRELLGDIVFSLTGLLVGIMCCMHGLILGFFGVVLIGMVVILFFTPE